VIAADRRTAFDTAPGDGHVPQMTPKADLDQDICVHIFTVSATKPGRAPTPYPARPSESAIRSWKSRRPPVRVYQQTTRSNAAKVPMIASTTQIFPKGVMGFLRFLFHLYRVRNLLAGYTGLISFEFKRGWRTLTVWENEESMKRFRNDSVHLAAMKDTRKIVRAKTVSWETTHAPTWQEAIRRLDECP